MHALKLATINIVWLAFRGASFMYSDLCDCGQTKSRVALHCFQCASILRRKVERPSKEQLEEELKVNSASALGRKYGVSSVTIGKWKKFYGIGVSADPENVAV